MPTDHQIIRCPVGNALFCKNMAALWNVDPQLAMRVDRIADEDRLELEPTKSEDWTAAVHTASGVKAYLHSRYRPIEEAEKLAANADTDDKFCFVLAGFGLGYHVRALFDEINSEAALIVTEPSLAVLSTALCCVDLSDAIASRRLLILTDTDKSNLHDRLTPVNALIMIGLQFVVHPPSEKINADFHKALRQAITDFVSYSRTTMVTLVHNAQITCRNIAVNLPVYLSTPPIDILYNKFAGYPGIVVSAGPSLRKNIHLLDKAKGKAALVAVQTAFQPLLERNIVPDFVTSLDFHQMSRRFFQGIDDFRDVHLVAEPKCTWHVLDTFDGPVSLLDSSFARLLVGDCLGGRDGLLPGATVAHLAFYLVRYLGCNPIIFLGQDLGYTGHIFYVPGVEVHKTWRSEINRFNTMETKEWERIVRNRAILRKVEDINGQQVYTDELLFTYLEQFEKDFTQTSAQLIDATEGGAKMRGTDVMPFADVLEKYCNRDLPAGIWDYRKTTNWQDKSRLEAGRKEIVTRLEEVQKIEALCNECMDLLKELQGLTHDPNKFNRRIARLDEVRLTVKKYDRAYRIINAASQLAELQRYTADRRLGAKGSKGADRAKAQLKRDLAFVQAMKKGASDMADIFHDTLERFDDALAAENPA